VTVASVRTADTAFEVRLDAFAGPLDLLMQLIREQEIDIADIPIAQIADQFLQVIGQLGLNDAADYVEMAAQLLRIKIQLLLPRPFDDTEWEDPRAELVRRLLEYEQMREVADWLAEQARQHGDRFARGWVGERPELPESPMTMDIQELLLAAERVVEAMPEPVLHRVVPRPLDVEGATRRIRELFGSRDECTLGEVLGTRPNIADLISSLLALLELARIGFIRLRQQQPFGSVVIRREPADTTFASPHPLSLTECRKLAPDVSREEVIEAIETLRRHYDEGEHAVEVIEVAEGYQITTRPHFAEAVAEAQLVRRPRRLSQAALETLAVVAYRQPVSRAEIEEIRGVAVDGVLRLLQERGIVEAVGRGEGLGRPLLYGTTALFLELLGLRTRDELPNLDELSVALQPAADRGAPAEA
jgi:segregation and condensation protein B